MSQTLWKGWNLRYQLDEPQAADLQRRLQRTQKTITGPLIRKRSEVQVLLGPPEKIR